MAVRFEAAATAANVGRLQRASSITSAPYTVLVWMLSDAAAATGTEVFDLYSNDWSSDAWIELESNDRAIILGTDTYTYSANKYNHSTWHCYAMVRSGTTQTGYRIDGGVVLTRTTSTPSDFDLETLLGYEDDPDSSACAVAHYKSWHAALTLEELAKEMQQFAPVRTANLASWSKFDVHTDLSDEIAESWTAINQTPTTVAGPTGIPEEWEGPRVASSATTAGTTSASGLSCNMPSGITAGDLLMAFAANDTSVSWSASAGWEKIDDGANGSAVQGACWARIATGSDALTITGEENDIAVVVERIVNHGVTDVTTDIIKGTAATGSSNAPNGPNCNPGTSGKYLWITQYSADDDDDTAIWWPVEGAPVAQVKSETGTSSCQVGVAYRWLEASSYDPSAFELSASKEWRAQTFAIPPYAVAQDFTAEFDVTAVVEQDLVVSYDAIAEVSQDLSVTCDIFSEVEQSFEVEYGIGGTALADYAPEWGVVNATEVDFAASWDALEAIEQAYPSSWSIESTASADFPVSWVVRNEVVASIGFTWSTIASVLADLVPTWDLTDLNPVEADLAAQWNVYDTIAVSRDLAPEWSLFDAASQDAAVSWSITAAVLRDYGAQWDLQTNASQVLDAAWNVHNAVEQDLTVEPDVLTAAENDLAAQWDAAGTSSGDLAIAWDLGQAVAADMAQVWNILAQAERTYQAIWSNAAAYVLDQDGIGLYQFEVPTDEWQFEVPTDEWQFEVEAQELEFEVPADGD